MIEAALKGDLDNPDTLYEKAVAFVEKTRDPRCSPLQRHLRIGYGLAMQLIERMQAEDICRDIASLAEPKAVCIRVVVLGTDAASTAALVRGKIGSQAEIIALDTLELAGRLAQAGLARQAAGLAEEQEDVLTLLRRCAPGYLVQLHELVNGFQLVVVAGNCEQGTDRFVAHVVMQLARQQGAITVSVSPPGRGHERARSQVQSMRPACRADLLFTLALPGSESTSASAPASLPQYAQGLVDIVQAFARMISCPWGQRFVY